MPGLPAPRQRKSRPLASFAWAQEFAIYAAQRNRMLPPFFSRCASSEIFPRTENCRSTASKIMRKKTNSTKKATAPAGRSAKPAAGKKAPALGAATKPKSRKKSQGTPAPPSTDDIATRAYFIAEKRRADGLPGDEQQDWIEAERQLLAEAAGKSRPAQS